MYDRDKWMKHVEEGIAKGPYSDDWGSLSEHEAPKWFRDGKFGIFLHWGLYSVPAFSNEWYSRNMYQQHMPEYKHHVETFGDPKDFGYKDFIPMFKAEKFDPKAWAQLFDEAGAKYVVPVAEHHDGFQMYKSELSEWNAADMGPKRDLVGDLTKAIQEEGLVNGASTHRIEHYFFFNGGREFESDVPANAEKCGDFYWPAVQGDYDDLVFNNRFEPAPSAEFLEDWMFRTIEIIDHLHPQQLYFDWWIMQEAARPYLRKIAAYYYNAGEEWGKEVMIINKNDAFPFGTAVPDTERGSFPNAQPAPWQTDTAVAKNSWCYTEGNDFKKPEVILRDFVDAIAKNGSMLLNVGPKADGTISEEDTAILKSIGKWMHANAEAVYGSRPFRIAEEGPTGPKQGAFADGTDTSFTSEDFRFTVNRGKLYVFAMHWPENGEVYVKSLPRKKQPSQTDFAGILEDVQVLGFEGALGTPVETIWSQDEGGLHIKAEGIVSEAPVVFRVVLK